MTRQLMNALGVTSLFSNPALTPSAGFVLSARVSSLMSSLSASRPRREYSGPLRLAGRIPMASRWGPACCATRLFRGWSNAMGHHACLSCTFQARLLLWPSPAPARLAFPSCGRKTRRGTRRSSPLRSMRLCAVCAIPRPRHAVVGTADHCTASGTSARPHRLSGMCGA